MVQTRSRDQLVPPADPHSPGGCPERPWLRHQRRTRIPLFASWMSAMPTSSAKGGRSVTFLLRQPRQTQGFRELLRADGEAEALTLLWIPPG
jgi:hypothetical protein